jgi:parallel beta-helix repeat protein
LDLVEGDGMRKIISLLIMLAIFLTGVFVYPGLSEHDDGSARSARAKTLYVGPGQTYSKIQNAVDAANPRDTIRVYAGTYYEKVTINKWIHLVGNGTSDTIINGSSSGAIRIDSDNCSITGFTITGNGTGIYLNSDGNMIKDIICRETGQDGLYLFESSKNYIFNYKSYLNINGIFQIRSNNNTIIRVNCSNNIGRGISLSDSHHNVVRNSIFNRNKMRGIQLVDSRYNLIVFNNITDNHQEPVRLYDDSKYNRIFCNNFINGSGVNNVIDNGAKNSWNGSKKGNHWSNWISPDNNGNGIVDNPYNINGNANSKDHFPLVDHVDITSGTPIILTENVLSVYVNRHYSVEYSASDPDTSNNNLIWTMKTNASWLDFSSSQELYGTSLFSDIGSYWINITVSDGNNSDWTNFSLKVKKKKVQPDPSGRVINQRNGLRYSKIQDAVDNAISGDTIRVWAGIYYENVIVDRRLILIGNGSGDTTINGNNKDCVIVLNATGCNITGFNITGSGIDKYSSWPDFDAGIKVYQNNIKIYGCRLYGNKYGIQVFKGNHFLIENSILDNNSYGLVVYSNNETEIINCSLSSNKYGGVYINIGNKFNITKCLIYSNFKENGISLYKSTNGIIYNCNISKNHEYGLYFGGYNSEIKIIGNTFYNNRNGQIVNGKDNLIYYNNFIFDDTVNYKSAWDFDGNNWDNGFEGNYWYNWTSPDKDGDGIVDYPFDVPPMGGAKDNYPLVHPVKVTILIINQPPKISTLNAYTAYVGFLYVVNYTATDPDTPQQNLSWSMSTNASWLTFSKTQSLSGTPTESDIGTYWVYISVSDGEYIDSTNFTINVIRGYFPPQPGNGSIIIVRTGQKFNKIQNAINHAINSDTILVNEGVYKENILVNKELKIISKNGTLKTKIIPKVFNSPAIKIISNNVTIEGFTIKGKDPSNRTIHPHEILFSGIYIESAYYCNISSNIIHNFFFCIVITGNISSVPYIMGRYNVIYNNDVSDFPGYGIRIITHFPSTWVSLKRNSSSNTKVINNRVWDGYIGISLVANSNIIKNNNITNCEIGIRIDSHLNVVNKNNIINDLNNLTKGIMLNHASSNTITENKIMGNNIGIELKYTDDNIIYLNELNNNYDNARSDDNETTTNSGDGIWRTYHNKNDWNSTKKIKYTYNGKNFTDYLGNYWWNWTSPDYNGDGIVEKPYIISRSSFSKDFHPLVKSMGAGVTESPPVISTVNILSAFVGKLYSVYYWASDLDTPKEKLTWTMKTNASWLNFSLSQILFGTPSISDIGTYWVYIEVFDGNLTDSTNFTITVFLKQIKPNEKNPYINYNNLEKNNYNVSINTSELVIRFSKPMNRTSVEAALNISPNVNYKLLWNNDSTELKIILLENLSYDTSYKITIGTGAKDIYGNKLESEFKLNFTTEEKSAIDESKPGTDEDAIIMIYAVVAVIIILIFLIVLAFIIRSKKQREEEEDRIGMEKTGDEDMIDLNGTEELIEGLKSEALVPNKPSDFGLSKDQMLEMFRGKYEKGDISEDTYNSILESMSEEKP